MTEQLIEKLQYLDATLRDIRQRYDAVLHELNELKTNPQTNLEEIERLKQQHTTEQNALENKLGELDTAYQNLAEAHHELNDKYNELTKKCEALEKSNHTLLEKNRLAKEHTKVVMQRLTLIDQAVD